ncbi:ADAM family mig-17 [Aphelenchoides fujianensis]|nr:ADAM family mig-17 [Aphelenchoides fujianensis]
MAYVRAMCRGPDSTSVVEDVGGFATAVIAAHELAHNLGAFHDGSGNSSECAGRANFLMSPTTSGNEQSERFGNSVLLSECSVRQIEEFLESPDSDCLRWPKRKEESKVPRWTPERQPPGVVFDRTQQCRVAFGPNYGVCTVRSTKSRLQSAKRTTFAAGLWCKNRAEHRFNSCETRAYLPLMDGTPCGNRKHCMSGSCVQDEGAARLDETCIDIRVDYCRKFASPINRPNVRCEERARDVLSNVRRPLAASAFRRS